MKECKGLFCNHTLQSDPKLQNLEMTNTKKKAEMKKTKSKMKESKTPATKQDANTMNMQPATKKTSKGAGKTKTKAKKSQNTV
jgi:hypothetical protein